jgi:hypothetical protein
MLPPVVEATIGAADEAWVAAMLTGPAAMLTGPTVLAGPAATLTGPAGLAIGALLAAVFGAETGIEAGEAATPIAGAP